jgi:NhaA family Na+:H+ antiporter
MEQTKPAMRLPVPVPHDTFRRARENVIKPLFQKVLRPIHAFLHFEAAGGVLMLLAAVVAMLWANSPWGDVYRHLVHLPLGVRVGEGPEVGFTVHQLVNDGLMAVFFFVVGMEIKRELAVGELRSPERALLPAVAALAGMAVPAGIYVAFNWGTPAMKGWAIPMATDIAFAIGVVTLLKSRVSWSLIVFLTALAIFDDMGGILVIALFYGTGIQLDWLLGSGAVAAVLFLMGRLYVRSAVAWGLLGGVLWYTVHHAGIHATISGVILGLMIPARSRTPGTVVLEALHRYLGELAGRSKEENLTNAELLHIEERLLELEPPLNRFVHALHGPVAFGIIPVFALANAGVDVRAMNVSDLLSPVPLGIALGLFAGKQLGIFALTWAALRFRVAPMPTGGTGMQLWGVSTVAGIGFTVALFVASLAFASDPATLEQAKLGILVGSLLAAVVGAGILRLCPPLAGAMKAPSALSDEDPAPARS